METRLKERLTGAAILVALIVLLVPEMFHGQHHDVGANAGSSAEGAPVRSYTIDLSNGPARTAPLQSTPGTSGATATAETGAESSTRLAPSTPATNSTPAALPAAHTGSAVNAPVSASPPILPIANAPVSKRPSAAAWSVQLGLFAQRDNAERLAHSAQTKGFAVTVSSPDTKGRFHVRASGLADRASAQALQQRLRDQGFTAAIVAP